MKAFCPRCGDETQGFGSRGLCKECYTNEEQLLELPDELSVERCQHCGRVKIGMEWLEADTDREVIYHVLDHEIDEDDLVQAVRFEETGDGYDVGVLVEREMNEETVQDEVLTNIVVEKVQCDLCSKFHGGFYRYQLQVRGEHVDDALERMMDAAADKTEQDREHFVSNVEEADGGYDVFVSTRDLAEELIKVVKEQYTVETTRTKELVGEQDGQRVYRSVVSVRIA